jgi:hypothetical protein
VICLPENPPSDQLLALLVISGVVKAEEVLPRILAGVLIGVVLWLFDSSQHRAAFIILPEMRGIGPEAHDISIALYSRTNMLYIFPDRLLIGH